LHGKESHMFVPVAIYEIPGHRLEEAVGKFRDAIGEISEMKDLSEVCTFWLVPTPTVR
jgi:hypothetical protein